MTFKKHFCYGSIYWTSSKHPNYKILCRNGIYNIQKNGKYIVSNSICRKFSSISDAESWVTSHDNMDILCYRMIPQSARNKVLAAINTKDFSNKLIRVKSSNVWSIGLNMKNRKDKVGDLLVQFKNTNGGPGDVYMYYDVPFTLYRKWQTASSKGHFFWKYIRNYYKYSKLTGDKHGKLSNAVS